MATACRFDDLRDGRAFELTGLVGELVATTPDEVAAVLDGVEAAAGAGRFAAGFVAYEAAPAFDRALVVRAGGDEGGATLPLAWFGVFAERQSVPVVAPADRALEWRWTPDLDEAAHGRAVERLRAAIADGWSYQVNLTTLFRAAGVDDPESLYRQLATSQAGAYHAYLATDDWAIACGSPELFFTRVGDELTTRPMKGTAPRGRHRGEDEEQAAALVASAKERAENLMIVDLLRNDLGRIARTGTVAVPSLHTLERYPGIWQTTSTVTARLPAATGLAAVFSALFPCGSVTGAPKPSTTALIAHEERSPRGVYCGAVGHVSPPAAAGEAPSACFAVAIRTAVVDRRSGRATFGAGGAITYASEARAEWAELCAKLRLVQSFQPEFELVETLRFTPDEGLRHLELHLERLEASATHFGFAYAPAEAAAAIDEAVASFTGPRRVRLLLGAKGDLTVESTPLDDPDWAGRRPVRLAVDLEPVDRLDPLVFHKTSRRDAYERRAARHAAADAVVLVNDRGEATETTRANLLVRLDGRWYTPPVESGLLAGVGRRVALASGEVAERPVTVAELFAAEALEVVSSLRGRLAAVLVGDGEGSPRSARPPG